MPCQSFRQSFNRGFTLIELLLVITIIGILAAIAIPMFSAYRIRGYNSAALTDIKNLATSEAIFFSDWAMFGGTEEAANLAAAVGGNPNAGNLVSFPPAAAGNIFMISGTDPGTGVVRALQVGISNGNYMLAGASNNNNNYTCVAKHINGDTVYGMDSDDEHTFVNTAAHGVGVPLNVATMPAPTSGMNNFGGVANWDVK